MDKIVLRHKTLSSATILVYHKKFRLSTCADFFDILTDELLGRTKNKKKVIAVDDVEFVRNCLKKILSENGCEVIGETTEGKELLNFFAISSSKNMALT